MAYIKGGTSLSLIDVGSATKAIRVEQRPTDVGTLGSYSIYTVTGTMAAGLAAAAPVYSCRWGDGTRTMLLRKIAIDVNILTAFTAGEARFDIIAARAFTASDTAQTSILPTGHSQKRRTSFGTTLITDLRQSSTATITAGTRTLDGAAWSAIRGWVPATAATGLLIPAIGTGTAASWGASPPQVLWGPDFAGEWPGVFVQNEGFIIRATMPATGTWNMGVLMEWSEVISTAGYN